MLEVLNTPVDAHLVVHYDNQDPSRGRCVTGTSICVGDEFGGRQDSATPFQRRLSASLRVCDLYQCVHSSSGHHALARRFSENISAPRPRQSITRTASYAADNDQRVRYLPEMPALPTWRPLCEASRRSSVDSANEDAVSATSTGSSGGSACGSDAPATHICNVCAPQQDCWVDLSTPCGRHHHRRNSTAIKFRKALYKES
ncbi:LAFE_0C02300g1_1 [Lachancea fermentati]|uniref:LAFE_0C02300g1_1 n=1 Tax=Lachancea fermentati TaxID=4955 RepID=A0A1G4M915_LACFM|nr:LAFE_0C02300g1_1 [Lachancea fermentati]